MTKLTRLCVECDGKWHGAEWSDSHKALIDLGMAKAKANRTKSGKAIGRPAIPKSKRQRIRDAYAIGDVSLRSLPKQFNVRPASVSGIVRKYDRDLGSKRKRDR